MSRAENKTLGLVGQTEIWIGHLYNLIQLLIKFWVAIAENCTENGLGSAVIFSSAVSENCNCAHPRSIITFLLPMYPRPRSCDFRYHALCFAFMQPNKVGGPGNEAASVFQCCILGRVLQQWLFIDYHINSDSCVHMSDRGIVPTSYYLDFKNLIS